MKSSTKDIAEGKLHQAKGKIKEVVGVAVNNHELEIKGKSEKAAGQVQEKVGQIEKVLEK